MSKFSELDLRIQALGQAAMKTVYEQGWMDAKAAMKKVYGIPVRSANTDGIVMELGEKEDEAEISRLREELKTQDAYHQKNYDVHHKVEQGLREKLKNSYDQSWMDKSLAREDEDAAEISRLRDKLSELETEREEFYLSDDELESTGITLDEREVPKNGYVSLVNNNDGWCRYSSLDELITDQINDVVDEFNACNKVYELGRQVRPATNVWKWEVKE